MSTKERKALGRGFGALLKAVDDVNVPDGSGGVAQLDITDIGFNPKQPRASFDDSGLEDLAKSIRIKGVIQPILVRENENGRESYELVAGERRLRASKLAGFDKIPALVKPIKDSELLEIALIENIQRENLNPIDESKAYRSLLEEHGYTQEDMAKRLGKNRSTIANFIRLLQLPKAIQDDLANLRLSTGHARTLLSLNNPEEQLKLRDKILSQNISVRETEEIIRAKKTRSKQKSPGKKEPLSPQMSLNQDRLRDFYGTKAKITPQGKKGRIEFEYFSLEDFNRIFALLMKRQDN